MKKDIEQLLIFLIPAILIEKLLATLSNEISKELISGDTSSLVSLTGIFPDLTVGWLIATMGLTNAVVALLPFLVLAVWLWRNESKSKGRPLLWAIGAIFLHYWILVLFIGQKLYEKNSAVNEHAI